MQPGREYWDRPAPMFRPGYHSPLKTTCTTEYLESRGYKGRKKTSTNQRSEVIPAVRSGELNAAAIDEQSELETSTVLKDESEQEASATIARIPVDGFNDILQTDFSNPAST